MPQSTDPNGSHIQPNRGRADQDSAPTTLVSGWRRVLYLGGAALFFVMGVCGAILPGIPATPFLLLTSYLLVRTSPRLNDRLLNSRILGGILKDWQVHGGVRPHIKLKAIGFVAATILLSLYLTRPPISLAASVIALAAVGVGVICCLPETK